MTNFSLNVSLSLFYFELSVKTFFAQGDRKEKKKFSQGEATKKAPTKESSLYRTQAFILLLSLYVRMLSGNLIHPLS